VHPQLFAFFVDPAGQPRPGGDQRLVGEVDGALVEGDQPRAGQPVQDQGDVRRLNWGVRGARRSRREVELGAVNGAAGVL